MYSFIFVSLFFGMTHLVQAQDHLVIKEMVVGEYFSKYTNNAERLAQASYQQKCAQWKISANTAAASALLRLDCGRVEKIHFAEGFLFQSEGSLTFDRAKVVAIKNERLTSNPVPYSKENAEWLAYEHFLSNCNELKNLNQQIIGGDLLYTSCGEGVSVDTMSARYASSAVVLFKSYNVSVVIEDSLYGFVQSLSDSVEMYKSSMKRYNENCEYFKRSVIAYSDLSNVINVSCGDAKGSFTSFGLEQTGKAQVYLKTDATNLTYIEKIEGSTYEKATDALRSFYRHCNAWKEKMQRQHQSNVVYLSCGDVKPTVNGYGFLFKSVAAAYLK